MSRTRRSQDVAVALFDANAPPALAFLRSLGAAGVPVDVYSHDRWPAARLSRHARRFARCPPTLDTDRFLPWLEARLRSGEIQLVAPTSDGVAFALAELAAALPVAFRHAYPDPASSLNALFKDRFDAACRAQGVRVPPALYPRSREEALALADSVAFPAILKPRSHVGVGGVRGEVVSTADELRRAYHPYPVGAGSSGIFARYPELRWPSIQEYIPSALENLYSISGFIAQDGRVIAAAASRKTGQWPPALGVGTRFEAVNDPALIAYGARAARAVLGHGLFELELIRDPRDGAYVAIDLNPRAYGQIRFEIARHLNLPLLWYRAALGHTLTPATPSKTNVVWLHSLPFHISQLASIALGPERASLLAEYALVMLKPHIDIVNDASDPLPTLAHTANMLRHPGGLIRPFLARVPRR